MKKEVLKFKEEAKGNIFLDTENRQLYTENGGVIPVEVPEDFTEEKGRRVEAEAEANADTWAALYESTL